MFPKENVFVELTSDQTGQGMIGVFDSNLSLTASYTSIQSQDFFPWSERMKSLSFSSNKN